MVYSTIWRAVNLSAKINSEKLRCEDTENRVLHEKKY